MAEDRVLSRQELLDLVWSKPMRDLAREFKLSDVGLAKACNRHNIPRPERGYWAKLAVGKAPKRPKLPAAPEGVGDQVRFHIPDDPVPRPEPVISPEVASWIEREHDPKNKTRVPQSVHQYHPLVRRAKDALEAKREHFGPDDGWRWSGQNAFSIRATKPLIGRACRLAHALLTGLEHRKFRVEYSREHNTVVAHVLGETFKLSLVERQKRIAHVATPDELRREKQGLGSPRKYEDVPSGLLRLTAECGYRKLQLEDREGRSLEDQLNDVVLWMVRTVIEVLRPEAERRRVAEEKRREEEHKRWVYQEKCDRFDAAFCAWSAQQNRLRFVAVLEDAVANLENPSDVVRDYVAWTRRYVAAADPLSKFFEALSEGRSASYLDFTPPHRRY